MLLPYSASSSRRSIFWTLLSVAVLAMGGFIPVGLLTGRDSMIPAVLTLCSGIVAMAFLCVWCATYVRDEAGLVRVALVWGAILFLLLTVGVFWAAFTPSRGDTKQMRVQFDIQSIKTSLRYYNGIHGSYPTTEEGLKTLVPKLMEEVPKDPWGKPYVYRFPGQKNPAGYDLFSSGFDWTPDTPDDDWGKSPHSNY
jgi:general secretion pathway protein G